MMVRNISAGFDSVFGDCRTVKDIFLSVVVERLQGEVSLIDVAETAGKCLCCI
jgi:hypothetical protein